MWQQWVNVLLGLWIIGSGYVGFTAQGLTTNSTIVGILVALLALWGALEYTSRSGDHSRVRM